MLELILSESNNLDNLGGVFAMFDVKAFKERLRAKREALGISQEDFAKKIGIARASASYYENVKNTALPNAEVLYKMAECLDVSVDFLLGRSITERPEQANIYEATGLGERALEHLKVDIEVDQDYAGDFITSELLRNEFRKAFDAFVSSEYFFECISYFSAHIYPDGKWNKVFEAELSEAYTQDRFQRLFKDRYAFTVATSVFSKMLDKTAETETEGYGK